MSHPDPSDDASARNSRLRRWGMSAIWILAIGAVVYYGFRLLRPISVVVLAVVLALFPTAVLWTPVRWLERHRWPSLLATGSVMLAAAALLVGIGFLVFPAIGSNIGEVTGDVGRAGQEVRNWLTNGPIGLTEAQVDDFWQSVTEAASGSLRSGLLGGASAAIDVLTGLAVMIVTTFFFLKDGERVKHAVLERLQPERSQPVGRAIEVGWTSLSTYMRGLAIVGFFDAVLIGVGLAIVGVPLVFSLSVLVFFGAFFPVVGAWITGLLAVAVAFVNGSVTDALIVLAIITVVQQVEGDVLLPIVFGQTLKMHPLLILLAVVAGGIAFGVVGAFLFVPILAIALSVHDALADDPDATLVAVARGVNGASSSGDDSDDRPSLPPDRRPGSPVFRRRNVDG